MRGFAAAVVSAVCFALVLTPTLARAETWVQFGSGATSNPSPGDDRPFSSGKADRSDRHRADRDRGGRHGGWRGRDDNDRDKARRHRDRRDRRFHDHRGLRIYRDDAKAIPVPPPPDPPPPETVTAPTPVPPPEPPDPRGPFRARLARGADPEAVSWTLGQPLPPGLPHVTLDWRHYDLPEPPPGRIYVRVGRAVLLITASGRVVEEIVDGG